MANSNLINFFLITRLIQAKFEIADSNAIRSFLIAALILCANLCS